MPRRGGARDARAARLGLGWRPVRGCTGEPRKMWAFAPTGREGGRTTHRQEPVRGPLRVFPRSPRRHEGLPRGGGEPEPPGAGAPAPPLAGTLRGYAGSRRAPFACMGTGLSPQKPKSGPRPWVSGPSP